MGNHRSRRLLIMSTIGETSNAMMTEEIKDFLSKNEAAVLELMRANALETRNGCVSIHFDSDGRIRKIEINAVVFRS